MSTDAAPSPSASGRRRGRRRARKSGRWQRVLLWTAGSLLVIAVAGWFGFSAWLRSYLRGESFRTFLSDKISGVLNAEGRIESITWRDSAAWVDEFRAEGRPGAAFRSLSIQDIRAGIDIGAVWDRTWKIEEVKIARLRIDASEGRLPAAPESAPAPAQTGGSAPAWLAQFIPNRTVIGEVRIGETDLIWNDGASSVQLTGLPLTLRSTDKHDAAMITGRGGQLVWSGLPGMKFTVRDLDLTAKDGDVRLDRLTAESTDEDSPARFEGDAQITKHQGDTDLMVNGKITGLDVKKIVPENWLQRLSGRTAMDGKFYGTLKKKETLRAKGRFSLVNGTLQALPMLEIIARKTRNEAFAHLQLREASADCMWNPRQLDLDRIFVDCPGLLRLRGQVSILSGETLQGNLLVGIAPNSLSFVAGAEDYVFVPLEKLNLSDSERRLVNSEDHVMRWARMSLGGTLSAPKEDLSDRLAQAWFNATVEQVLNMSMEEAIRHAEKVSRAAADLAGAAVETGTDAGKTLLEQAPKAVEKGIDAGGKAVEAGADLINGLINGK